MLWDFADTNPFSESGGNFGDAILTIARAVERLPAAPPAEACQRVAQHRSTEGAVLSTDPPYYDNVPYADLSDYLYIWLRQALKEIHPALLGTVLTPKAEELIAEPYRHAGTRNARDFFEAGFRGVFKNARQAAVDAVPISVFYAFKQSETEGVTG